MKFEVDIITFLQSGMGDFWLYFFRIVTLFGSWLGFVIALMVIFYKNKKLSYTFFGTFICGTLLNKVIKHFIARPRPFVTYQTILDLGGSTGYSMPSGHSCAVAMIAVFISYMAIKYGKSKATKICVPIFMTLFALLVMLSRIALGQHYLTDVLVGAGEGVIIAALGLVCFHFINKRQKENG